MGGGTFFIALVLGYSSQFFLVKFTSVIIAFALLLLIILVGITFDIIGMATAIAGKAPLHARAAKKIPGARQALSLLDNADRLASFSTDVVGDISGTLSGALGAVIIIRLLGQRGADNLIINTVMTAIIAALAVGGKAWGKVFALQEANEIVFFVGRVMYGLEKITGWYPFKQTPEKGRRP